MLSTINESDLVYHKRVASGGTSEVFHAIWTSEEFGEVEVAAKKIKIHPNEKLDEQLELEVDLLRILQHKNVIKFYGQIVTSTYVVIVTEYAAKGSLYDYLKTVDNLPYEKVRKWALEAAHGIQYLKNEGVLHRDIKSPNFLITADDTLKVCDFGIAKKQDTTKVTQTRDKGTLQWLAPEVFMDGLLSPKADVFAFGIVLWELNTCEIPYKGRIQQNIMFGVAKGERPTIPDSCPTNMKQLIQQCWEQDRRNRPDIDDIVGYLEMGEDVADMGMIAKDADVYTQDSLSSGMGALVKDPEVATGPLPIEEVATGPLPIEESVGNMEVDPPLPQDEEGDGWNTLSGLNITNMQKREIHGKILHSATEILCTHLPPQDILVKLKGRGILTDGDVSEIRNRSRTEEKVDRLLEILKRKSDKAYTTFMEALRETDKDLYHEVKKIERQVIREWRNTQLFGRVGAEQRASGAAGRPRSPYRPSQPYEDTSKISDYHFVDVIKPLGPTELRKLYIQLGMKQAAVEKAEQRANTNDVEMKAMEVLREWRRKLGSAATKEMLLEALESLENREVMEALEKKWGLGL